MVLAPLMPILFWRGLTALAVLVVAAVLLQLRRALVQAARLAEQRSALDLVLGSAPFGIALFDRDLRFERVNSALTTFDGVREELHAGHRVRDVAPNLAERIEPVLAKVLESERAELGVQFESADESTPGRVRQWTLNAYPVRTGEGVVRGIGAILIDTTERKDLERQLLHAQKMEAVGRLAGSIAHDFNNLLTAVAAFAQFALEGMASDHPSREDIGQIVLATERGSALTRRLLAFSRQQTLQPQALDLNRVMNSLEGLLRRLLGEDIALRLRLAPALASIEIDPGQIEQVILNLAVNARDAMPGGGTLIIETDNVEFDDEYARAHGDARPGPHVMISVIDTGTGMDLATQARAFEPFFTTKPLGMGTGLGLSTVYAIVQQSGGSISLHSERGRGTEFRVFFPRGAHAAERGAAPVDAASRPSLAPTSVLVVEDDASVRHAVHRVLAKNGCTVFDAENGRQAFEILERLEGAVDLIVTDVIMPEMGGLEFAAHVRERWPSARLLFMSGYAAETMQRQALTDAGASFIEKPFTSQVLLAKVREALEKRSQEGTAAA